MKNSWKKCICSVTGQTFRDLEILVVNDGSTDRSGEILERLAAGDSRIVYISQEKPGSGGGQKPGS